jgi:hypothetical protein
LQPEGKSIAPVHFGLLGSIPRQGKERVVTMGLNADGSLLACQGADKTVEMYHVRSDEEVKKKLKRRAKRLKEKARAHSNGMANARDGDVRRICRPILDYDLLFKNE